MSLRETLNFVGKIVARVIVIIMFFQFLWVWNTKCNIDQIDTAPDCIWNLVMMIIPTEATIAQLLNSSPYLMIIVLFLYWKFISPHLKK